MKTRVILNPRSAHGATGRRWPALESVLRESLGEFEVQRTLGRRDAERIAVEAAHEGAQRIIVAGGDGTASEVVSGLLGAGLAAGVEVGFLPLGTGRDFPRTLGAPSDFARAAAALGRGATRQLDALRVSYRDASGAPRTSHSINVTSFGLSGLTVQLVSSAPHALGGSFAFLVGAIASITRYRCQDVRIVVDGEVVCDGPLVLAACANGRYFGGGMHIAPMAVPDDGRFELVVVRGMSKAALIANLPGLYRGTHVRHPNVSVHSATHVEATPCDPSGAPVRIDVDGESLGALPIAVEILPRAVTVLGAGS